MKNIGEKRKKAPFLLCYEFPVTTFLKTKCIYKLKQRVILHFQHPKVLLNLVFYIKPCYFRDSYKKNMFSFGHCLNQVSPPLPPICVPLFFYVKNDVLARITEPSNGDYDNDGSNNCD